MASEAGRFEAAKARVQAANIAAQASRDAQAAVAESRTARLSGEAELRADNRFKQLVAMHEPLVIAELKNEALSDAQKEQIKNKYYKTLLEGRKAIYRDLENRGGPKIDLSPTPTPSGNTRIKFDAQGNQIKG